MSGDRPTLRERVTEAGHAALCVYDRTDGFCGGRADCSRCGRLGAQIALSVLQHIRPTLKRLLTERGADPDPVLALIDEALG